MTHADLHLHSVAYSGLVSGPRLIILGAVHGNETCGTQAIRRVIADIEQDRLHIHRGSVTLVPVTNPLAYRLGLRAGERNLNRHLQPTDTPRQFEDHVANWLCPLLAQHDVLLDLHSFHTAGQPFVMLGPDDNNGALEPFALASTELALARRLGVRRFVDGWLDTYARGVTRRLAEAQRSGRPPHPLQTQARYGVGTTEYMRSVGGYGLTLECGQHQDPAAPTVAYQAILNTLTYLGMIDGNPPEPIADAESLRIHEVIDREHADDRLARDWASFDRLQPGDLIGTRHDGTAVLAQEEGYILFPNPQAEPGQEWFYLARPVQRA